MKLARKRLPSLTIRDVQCTPVSVPMRYVLGTSAATVTNAPLLLVDLSTDQGVVGRAYSFCYRVAGAKAVREILFDAVDASRGDAVDPVAISDKLARRFALLGVSGPVRMALSLLDMALWDAIAVAEDKPMAELLGGSMGPVPAYNSCGLGLMPADKAADEALRLLEGGFGAVKMRLGHELLRTDLQVAHAVRKALPEDVHLLVDYNQALPVREALRRGRALEAEGVHWLEEPIKHDDYLSYATLSAELSLPIQIGENFNGPESMQLALDLEACDLAMPDVARIGGITGWMQAAAIAAARKIPMSSHLMPEISVHLLAATPTAHWLEYVDWLDPLVLEPLRIAEGYVRPSSRPGLGLAWNDAQVDRYRIP